LIVVLHDSEHSFSGKFSNTGLDQW